MRISLVTETFPPEVNGVARTLEHLVAGLAARGHEVEVVRPRRRDIVDDDHGYEQVQVPGAPLPGYGRLRFGFFCRGRLLRRWRERPPAVVHVATEGPLGIAALLAARRLGIPVCSSFHTNFHTYGRFYGYGWLLEQAVAYLRAVHNRADCTLVPAADTLEKLERQGFRNLGILGRGVDAQLFSPARRSDELRAAWGTEAGGPVVLYVGRLASEKNIDLVFTAFEAARTACPGARLVLVGDGPKEAALRRANPEAVFCGVRHGEDLATHYASGDVMLFPSVTETFGNVVLEGMASGLPVVAYDYAAARRHITDGVNGLTAPFGDADAFTAAAARLAGEPELWRRLGAAARRTAEEASWERIVDQFEERLRGLARTSHPDS